MFLLPLLVVALASSVLYVGLHHRARRATGMVDAPLTVEARRTPFWPTTVVGKFAVGALAVGVLLEVLVNVIQVGYFGAAVLLAALVLSGIARFVQHDHSTSVLIAFAVSTLAVVAGLLFLAGEVFIGHD